MTFWAFAFLIPCIAFFSLALYLVERYEGLTAISLGISCMLFIPSAIIPIKEFKSEKKAEFYNTHFGTNYTANDFFWYGEEIENMLIGKKVRVGK